VRRTLVCLALCFGTALPAAAAAKVEISPYGFVLVNASYSTRAVTDYPVLAPAMGSGEPSFVITPRQSRLGMKMKSDAEHSPAGCVEVDFWGLRGSGGNGGPTQSAVRLRRAFVELDLGAVDLLAGQEWSVVAPLNPTSIMHVAIVGMMSSGNLWARFPQVRATVHPVADETRDLKCELALTRPFGGDGVMTPVEQGDVLAAGERYGWPWIQGRVGYAAKGAVSVTAGVGGQYGREDFGKDPAGDENFGTSAVVAGDLQITAGRLTLSGEVYSGRNIPSFYSNARYALVPDSMQVDGVWRRYGRFEGIRTTGGWGEIKVAATGTTDVAVNAGVETLDDEFLAEAAVQSNLTVMGNVIYKGIKGVQLGIEAGYIKTERIADDPGTDAKETDDGRENLNANVSMMFSF
jgi:hypothetical protein